MISENYYFSPISCRTNLHHPYVDDRIFYAVYILLTDHTDAMDGGGQRPVRLYDGLVMLPAGVAYESLAAFAFVYSESKYRVGYRRVNCVWQTLHLSAS